MLVAVKDSRHSHAHQGAGAQPGVDCQQYMTENASGVQHEIPLSPASFDHAFLPGDVENFDLRSSPIDHNVLDRQARLQMRFGGITHGPS